MKQNNETKSSKKVTLSKGSYTFGSKTRTEEIEKVFGKKLLTALNQGTCLNSKQLNPIETLPLFQWLTKLESNAKAEELEFIRILQNKVLITESVDIEDLKHNAKWYKKQLDEALEENAALEEELRTPETDLSISQTANDELVLKINSLKTK